MSQLNVKSVSSRCTVFTLLILLLIKVSHRLKYSQIRKLRFLSFSADHKESDKTEKAELLQVHKA